MKKEFKVLKLTINKDNLTGTENLLAILSEIKTIPIEGLPFSPQLFNPEGTYFVMASYSSIAEYLVSNPENRKILDMTRFVEFTINIDDKIHKAFYDLDLVHLQNEAMRSSNKNEPFYKAVLSIDNSTYLYTALNKKLFSRPTNSELLFEANSSNSYAFYFERRYYQKLKSEINQAYIAGQFKKTSTENNWIDLKVAIDKAIGIESMETLNIKPYLSTLLENTEEIKRTVTFSSTLISISEGLLDLNPKKTEMKFFFEITIGESGTEIVVHDISKQIKSIIENLETQSFGDGGMTVQNQKYGIIIEWTKGNILDVTRLVVTFRQKDYRISYYN
jgi:hypothetical protein